MLELCYQGDLVKGQKSLRVGLNLLARFFREEESLENRPSWALKACATCQQSEELD